MAKSDSWVGLLVRGTVLFLLLLASQARAQSASARYPVLLAPGTKCTFLDECTQFDEIGLHIGTTAALRTDSARTYWDAQGALRLSLTALDLFEGGAVLAGRLSTQDAGGATLYASPVSLFARLRLLPLRLRALARAPLRLAVAYQHDLVAGPLGPSEPPGFSRGTLRLVAGQSLGRIDLDGNVGFVLAQLDGSRPRPLAFDLGVSASLWLFRPSGEEPAGSLRLTAEVLSRFSLNPAFPNEQNLLVGLLGQTASGYGGGIALGTQVRDQQAGFLAVVRLQVSWGKKHNNPWAERKAVEPKTTPVFIWELLGAIDPVVGADGWVWTDPTKERPSTRWFCIGTPAADDPSQIVLPDGKRIAVGTHLWQLGGTLRLDDGSKLVEIPLTQRFRKVVWDEIDRRKRLVEEDRASYHRQVCEGNFNILHGTEKDPGTAAMVTLDDHGSQAALLGAAIVRHMECDPNPSTEDQALMALTALSVARTRGPMRARPPMAGKLGEAGAGEGPANKTGSGVPAASVAEQSRSQGAASVPITLRSRIQESSYAMRLAEDMSQQAQSDIDKLLMQLANGNVNPGIGTRPLGGGFYELRGSNAGRVIVKRTSENAYDIIGKFQGHVRGDSANSAVINRLIENY